MDNLKKKVFERNKRKKKPGVLREMIFDIGSFPLLLVNKSPTVQRLWPGRLWFVLRDMTLCIVNSFYINCQW